MCLISFKNDILNIINIIILNSINNYRRFREIFNDISKEQHIIILYNNLF